MQRNPAGVPLEHAVLDVAAGEEVVAVVRKPVAGADTVVHVGHVRMVKKKIVMREGLLQDFPPELLSHYIWMTFPL